MYRQNILEWHNEKEDVWYSYLPDDSKSNKRKKIKRKRKRDLEDVICDFYSSMQSEHEDMEKKDYSIKSMFYEFMKHKSNEVGSGTIKRMMADWSRFYEPDQEFIAISVQNLTKINIDDFFNAILGNMLLMLNILRRILTVLKSIGRSSLVEVKSQVKKRSFRLMKKSGFLMRWRGG